LWQVIIECSFIPKKLDKTAKVKFFTLNNRVKLQKRCLISCSGAQKGEQQMQARGPLMIEHRLIERMLANVKNLLVQVGQTKKIDPLLVDKAVDFIRTYADRTHHGKEEDILFRDLNNKELSEIDRRVMNELIEEHVFGRKTTKALVEANTQYRNGDSSSLGDIVSCLNTLVDFYPKHIEKEDKVFFPASRAYFSETEDQTMLAEFMDFDQKMIHEKYKSVVEELEK
jgi:hemerythrin-like domain-containing protein